MKRNLINAALVAGIAIGAIGIQTASAQQAQGGNPADIPNTALVPQDMGDHANAANLDVTGIWEYATGPQAVHGRPCEYIGGRPGFSGLLEITRTDDAITMQFVSGATCDPESMCHFAGEIAQGYLVAYNSATVDGEGGVASNTLQFTFLDADHGIGSGGSTYRHPDGECGWTYDFVFHRPEMKDGEWVPGVATGSGASTD